MDIYIYIHTHTYIYTHIVFIHGRYSISIVYGCLWWPGPSVIIITSSSNFIKSIANHKLPEVNGTY